SHTAADSLEAKNEALSTVFGDVIRVRNGRLPVYPVPELRGAAIGGLQ
ncbi:MAG: hypothetical protein JWO42_1198, partial [Chloroflexi bacterium]|nr:hypothetical protein [Chloroflexota bacterium]